MVALLSIATLVVPPIYFRERKLGNPKTLGVTVIAPNKANESTKVALGGV